MDGEASTGSLTESSEVTQTEVPAQTEPITQPASTQQVPEKPEVPGFDAEWWKKDPRHTKIWGKTKQVIPVPVDGIKSWHEADKILETKYKPAYKQYEGIINRMKELGYDPEKVDDFFSEVKTLKDPQNPRNALGEFLLQWKDDPLLDDIEVFFKNLNLKKLQRDFPGWTPEGIQKFQGVQQELAQMRAEKEEQAKTELEENNKKAMAQIQADIKVESDKIKEWCKTMGFEFTEDVYNRLMEYGVKEGIHPKHLQYAFKELYADDLAKLEENKLKSKMMQDKDKRNKTVVPMTRRADRTHKESSDEELMNALRQEAKKT